MIYERIIYFDVSEKIVTVSSIYFSIYVLCAYFPTSFNERTHSFIRLFLFFLIDTKRLIKNTYFTASELKMTASFNSVPPQNNPFREYSLERKNRTLPPYYKYKLFRIFRATKRIYQAQRD